MTQHPGRRAEDIPGMATLGLGAPWWANFIVRILFWFGPTVLVAAVFLSMWTGWLPSPITRNTEILMRLETKMDAAITRMSIEVAESHRTDEHVIRLLLATCLNVAKDVVGRSQCQNYWMREVR